MAGIIISTSIETKLENKMKMNRKTQLAQMTFQGCEGGLDMRAPRFNTDTFKGRQAVRNVKKARRPIELFKARNR